MRQRFVHSLCLCGIACLCFMGAIFLFACSDVTSPGKTESQVRVPNWPEGQWRFEDRKKKAVVATLYRDGSALASNGTIGSWYFAEGQVYIIWMDGWTDVLYKSGQEYQKEGFAPGVATESSPSNSSLATKISDATPPVFVKP